MTDAQVKVLLPICLRAYAGGECPGCGKTLNTIEELSDAVYWPSPKGSVGHPACYALHITKPK